MKPLPMVPEPAANVPAPTSDTASIAPDALKTAELKPRIVDALRTVFDPEIPVNIWELGLVYDILVDAAGVAGIRMTLTAPGCPVAQSLPIEVADKVKAVPGVTDAKVDIVWEPAWTKDRMSEAAKLQLGLW
jgi:FeS assembly SUF system protein